MCKTTTAMLTSRRPSCFSSGGAAPNGGYGGSSSKRARDGHTKTTRPTKRVTFSTHEFVLGRADDYDRRSFEATPPAPPPPPQLQQQYQQQRVADTRYSSGVPAGNGEIPRANLSGMWRRSHGFNWAALLELSGVDKADIPEQTAKMQQSSVVHLIDHDDFSFRLVVHSDTGNTQDQHFFIGGQPRPSPFANANNGTSTLANMRWSNNGQALVLTSVDAASGDEMVVSRHLASQGSVMVQHYRARSARTGETAEAVTIFRRIHRGVDGTTAA